MSDSNPDKAADKGVSQTEGAGQDAASRAADRMMETRTATTIENIDIMGRAEKARAEEEERRKTGESLPGADRGAARAAAKSAGRMAPRKKTVLSADEKKKQKQRRLAMIGGGVAFVLLIIWYGLQPIRASMHYGICRTYVELRLIYPNTLTPMEIYWFRDGFRIYYIFTNPFGEEQGELAECLFNPDYTLREVSIDRRKEPDEKVQAFNQTIPAIVAGKPDLVVPGGYGADLMSLWRGKD